MEHGFLSQKGDGGRRGLKEKQQGVNEKISTIGDPSKVTVCVDEATNSTGDQAKGTNVFSNDDLFSVLNSPKNSSGWSPDAVKDGMDSGPGITFFVDLKVVEGVDELVSTIPKSFASLVTKEAVTSKVNFRSLDSDKPTNEAVTSKVNFRSLDSGKTINATAEVKIPKASILDVHSIFGFSLYGYFVGKRVAFPVVENYVKNAWKKFGLVRVMMNLKGFFFFKFASIEGVNGVLENDGLSVMATKLGNPIMLYSYTSSMCLQSWGRMDYARALIYVRVDRELKEDMVIAIPNVEDDGEVLHTVRVEYKWEPPRCGVCMVFGHDDMLCPKRPVEKPKKQHTNHDGYQHPSSSHSTNVGSKFQVKPKKPIWQVVSKKNSASSSGRKKNSEVYRKVMSSTNPFDALNTIEEGDELGSNEGSSNSGLMIWKVDDMVNEDNDSEVEEESHGKDPYDDDDFDDPGLTDAQMKFANTFDINLRGQLR
ncbi:probable indole-3-pyruvate monooxygenase YUCCA10 [Tanacetum coccineum]